MNTAEVIRVFLDMERNTRETNEILRAGLVGLGSLADQVAQLSDSRE